MLTRERGSGDWVGLVTEAVAVTVVGEVAGGLVTRARGSEDCLVGASLSWGMCDE